MIWRFGNRRLITAAVAALVPFLLQCCSYIQVVRASFFTAPTPKWSIQLQGSGRLSGRGLRKGNAIVANKDGTKIVVTANDGSLHIIQTTNQVKTLAVYVPDGKDGTNIGCRSEATIVYRKQQDGLYFPIDDEEENSIPTKEDFIVYAVVDSVITPDDTGRGITSRVIGVNMEGGFKWSVDVPGRIEGTPLVGKTGIYISHNVNDFGAMTILRIQPNDGMAVIAATVYNLAGERGRPTPFGPPTLRKPTDWEDERNSKDVVIVAENWEAGFSESKGGLYMLSSISSSATNNKDEKLSTVTATSYDYELVPISSWSYSASAPPLVYGDSIFVGAAGGIIGGFTGDRKNDLSGITSGKEDEISPRWNYKLLPNPQNASQPIQNQPVLDSEGKYLCVSGVDSDFYCLQSDNGRELWRDEEGTQILTRPQVFEGADWEKVVYVIETQNGRVRQYDLYSGRRYWDYSCTDISNQLCQDAVEAEFAITPSGNTIYYGDIYGRIISLEVANFETETPTIAPSSAPSGSPSGKPTITSVPTGVEPPTQMAQVTQDSSSPTSVAGKSTGLIIIDGDIEQQSQLDGGNNTSLSATSIDTKNSVIFDQESSEKDSNKIAAYIGAAIAGLCVLMIPIFVFSMLRRRRKKPTSSENLVVEIIEDCSPDDVESQADLNYFNRIETNNSCDPNNGDGIEIEIINRFTPPRGNAPKKKKNVLKRKENLPDTPDTVNSLESSEEILEDASAMVVVGEEYDVTDPSVEAVNLRQTFDGVADSRAVATGDVCLGAGSNHSELSDENKKGNDMSEDTVNDSNYFSDDDIPPPPPLPEESPASSSSKEWTWGSLLQIGTPQSSKKLNNSSQILLKKPSENHELKQSASVISPSQEESSSSMSTGSQKEIFTDERPKVPKETVLPIKKKKWKRKYKKKSSSSSLESEEDFADNDQAETPASMNQNEDSRTSINEELNRETSPEQAVVNSNKSEETESVTEEVVRDPVKYVTEEEIRESGEPHIGTQSSIPPSQAPPSPSTYPMLKDAVQSLSPVRSVQSIQESACSTPNYSSLKSVGSDDESLFTSYTGGTGGTDEKKQDVKEMSPLSNYIYEQDVYRRGRSEIVNEGKGFLAQPVLSKSYAGIGVQEHPDDEIAAAPGKKSLSEETKGQKYGRSVRSKRDSNSFKPGNSTESKVGHTPLAQMYDQLAAIGQQRRDEKKPAFKRRSKRTERNNSTPPSHQQQEQGDTWGSFLNELAEAEEHFFSPSASKSKILMNDSGPKGSEDAELK